MRGRNHRNNGSGSGGGGGTGQQVRHHSGGTPLNRNHVFDSNGPDLRIRGTSQQLFEKYLQLGRDATSSGDRVMAESYFQYAEHYFRILNAMNQAAQQGGAATNGGGHPQGQPRRPYGNEPGAENEGMDEPEPRIESRAPDAGMPESRTPESRTPESRTPEARVPEARPQNTRNSDTRNSDTRNHDARNHDARAPGTGDQPPLPESRDIPIAAAPPES